MWFKVLHSDGHVSKKGISALQIHRMLGTGSYQTAWYMCMRLRAGMKDPEFRQADGHCRSRRNVYRRQSTKNRHASNDKSMSVEPAGKIAVIGAISRKGKCGLQDDRAYRH